MGKSSKQKPQKVKVIDPTNKASGLVFSMEAYLICLRHFFVNEYGVDVSEEIATFSIHELIELIWRGESPFSWFKNEAEFINPNCQVSIEKDLFDFVNHEIDKYME